MCLGGLTDSQVKNIGFGFCTVVPTAVNPGNCN